MPLFLLQDSSDAAGGISRSTVAAGKPVPISESDPRGTFNHPLVSKAHMRRRSATRWTNRLSLLAACTCIVLATGLGTAFSRRRTLTVSQARVRTRTSPDGPCWPALSRTRLRPARGSPPSHNLGHAPYELYRGLQSVPDDLKAQGWTHIGDPDSSHGYIFDAYQGPATGNSKMFLVTTPSGQSFEHLHALVKGELYNNSFVAVSPDTQWMIAGEWGTMSHLQIYPTPLLNHIVHAGAGPLRLAGYVKLDHKVNDIQGCDFITAVRLVCASDDDSCNLFPNEKPLLEVELSRALHGSSVKGHVVDLGLSRKKAAVQAPSKRRESISTHQPTSCGWKSSNRAPAF